MRSHKAKNDVVKRMAPKLKQIQDEALKFAILIENICPDNTAAAQAISLIWKVQTCAEQSLIPGYE